MWEYLFVETVQNAELELLYVEYLLVESVQSTERYLLYVGISLGCKCTEHGALPAI